MRTAVLVIAIVTWLGACGPSYEERQAKEKADREAAREEAKRDYRKRLDTVGAKFAAVQFPDGSIVPDAFTFELQRFLDQTRGKPLVFEALLEDVEETPRGLVVAVSRPLHDGYFRKDDPLVVFRLNAKADQVGPILSELRKGGRERTWRHRRWLNCVVVAEVKALSRIRRYETYGSALDDDEVELSIEAPARFLAQGRLLEIAAIARSDRPRSAR